MGLQYALMYFNDVMGRLDLKNTKKIPKITLAGLQKGITHILYLQILRAPKTQQFSIFIGLRAFKF
tara:strand:- start:197 stop:394 length:198 start_codon:yes stop_codon:yes gene_type:complete